MARASTLDIVDSGHFERAFGMAREYSRKTSSWSASSPGATYKLILANSELVGIVCLSGEGAPALDNERDRDTPRSSRGAGRRGSRGDGWPAGAHARVPGHPPARRRVRRGRHSSTSTWRRYSTPSWRLDPPLLESARVPFVVQRSVPAGSVSRIPIVAVTGHQRENHHEPYVDPERFLDAGRASGLACSDGVTSGIGWTARRPGGCARPLSPSRESLLWNAQRRRRPVAPSRAWALPTTSARSRCASMSRRITSIIAVIHSLEQMARLKRTVLGAGGRGRGAEMRTTPRCLATAPGLRAMPFSCSMQRSLGELRGRHAHAHDFALLEHAYGEEWVVLDDHGQEDPVVQVKRIPASCDGLARDNVSNALHAIAAGYLAGSRSRR